MPTILNTAANNLQSAIDYLLSRHGHIVTTELELNDWISVTRLDEVDGILDSGGLGTWPRSNDAVVLFQSQSADIPYTDVDGFQRPNMVNHYYPVEDWSQRLVYDTVTNEVLSFKGRIPTSWASYSIAPLKPTEYEQSKIPVQDDNFPGITYERFPRPRRMYVSNLAGANKVDFGKAANWNDVGKAVISHLEYGTEVYILGQAHHPMLPVGATFYMDAAAMGIFKSTGKAAATYGYSKFDLNDHLLAKPVPASVVLEPETEPEAIPITVGHEPSVMSKLTEYYKPFLDQQGRKEIRRFVAINIPKSDIFHEIVEENYHEIEVAFVWIKDCAGRRQPHKFRVGAEVDLAGMFGFEGKLMGRPARVESAGDWYGIDMDWLVLKSELYSTATTVTERKALKTLKVGDYVPAARGYAEATFNQFIDVVKRRIRKQK